MHANKAPIIKGELQESVPLYNFICDDQTNDRICLSNGVYPAAQRSTSDIKYASSAYIPLPPWRMPTEREMDALLVKEVPYNYSASIGLLKIPKDVLEPFNALGLPSISDQSDFYTLIQTPKGKAAVHGAEKFVRSLLVKEGELQTIIAFNQPGLDSTAYVHEIDCFMGLHVDYMHQQPIYARDHSSNRISINLGNEDRYIIYINLTMRDLIELIEPTKNCSNDELVLKFFEQFPKYPVVKVKISPGEAYIAPTQNIIHNGIGAKNAPDVNLTICGYIGFSGISSLTQPNKTQI